MNKRGMSAVILTIVMIGLVLVATTIVWGVVSNILIQQSDSASSSSIGIDLDIEKYEMTGNGLQVTLERGSGKGDLVGVAFIGNTDGILKSISYPTTLEELGTETFVLEGIYAPDSISIAPITKTSSGKEITQQIVEEKKIDRSRMSQNYMDNLEGLISWWRFDGDATDTIGNNDGIPYGSINCNAAGKFGKACSFDGTNDYIKLGSSPNFITPLNSQISLAFWFKSTHTAELPVLTFHGGYWFSYVTLFSLAYDNHYKPIIRGGDNNFKVFKKLNSELLDGEWHHAVFVVPGMYASNVDSYSLYVDGTPLLKDYSTASGNWRADISTYSTDMGRVNMAGTYRFFKGQIDEPMIFNRALTDSEIQALYSLDLTEQ